MRVNVYAEEMTDRIEIVSKEIDGRTYTGLRFYLALPVTMRQKGVPPASGASIPQQVSDPFVHRPGDDDSSAVTFWGKEDLRGLLYQAIGILNQHYEVGKNG